MSHTNRLRHKFVKIFELYDGTHAGLPLLIKSAPRPGPRLVLVGAVHGEEVVGTAIIHEVLRKITLTRGTLIGIPAANVGGMQLGSRYVPYGEQSVWENLNRLFPGNKRGTPAERIAAALYATIVRCRPDLVIDLHADSHNSIPYLLLDHLIRKPDAKLLERTERLAELFGITVCYDDTLKEYLAEESHKTLTGCLFNKARLPALVVELGGPTVVRREFVEYGIAGVRNVLSGLAMLREHPKPWVAATRIRERRKLRTLNVPGPARSGKITYLVAPGEKVAKGEILATIENVFGVARERIRAPASGYVLSLGYHVLAFPGLTVATLAVPNR